MAKLSKRVRAFREKVDANQSYSLDDAIALLKEFGTVKFNETVEVAVNLGVDARKSDQGVRGATTLPHGTGSEVRVAVFTQGVEPGLPIPVVITVYSDKSFTYIKKTPPASILLKKIAGIKSGSGRPNTEKVGKVTRAQLEEVANQKWPDLTAADMDAAVRTIAGSARSAGIETEGVN